MKKGFTLIELLVVISIIGFLSSIILASFNSSREKSKIAYAVSELRELEKSIHLYYSDTNQIPPNCSIQYTGNVVQICTKNEDPFRTSLGVAGWNGPYISALVTQHPWRGRIGFESISSFGGQPLVSPVSFFIFDDDWLAQSDDYSIPGASILAVDKILDDGNTGTGRLIGDGGNLFGILQSTGLPVQLSHTATGEFIFVVNP